MRAKLEGPCQDCGKPLAEHSRRQLRYCREAPFRFLADLATMAGILWFFGKITLDPKGFEKEVKKVADTYTEGIKALTKIEE